MKRFLKNRKAKGFTLVELLIVLIIIGILAGALLLVAGAGTDKANATKIVSNLRSYKAAALMAYSDNLAWPTTMASIEPYIDKSISSADFALEDNGNEWYIGYAKTTIMTDNVKQKLEDIGNSGVPLLGTSAIGTAHSSTDAYEKTDEAIWMKIN